MRPPATRRHLRGRKATPFFQWHGGDGHQGELADHESDQPWKCLLHEAVGMQADAEHVHAEPRETGDDVAEDRHDHQTALPDEPAPARVQSDCAPKDDQHRAVFLGIPAPETAPRLIGPDAAEDCADETEQRRETNDAVGHARERIRGLLFQRAREDAAHDVDDGKHTGEKHGGVTGGDRDDVRGQPDVGVEHGLQHFQGVAAAGEMMRDDQGHKTNRARARRADAVSENSFKYQRDNDRAPADENCR